MTQHFWVAGTDTDVGKTVVTGCFLRYFQKKGRKAVPYKPVQTGVTTGHSNASSSDTSYYQYVSAAPLVEDHLNTYSFKEPASPHYAAMLEGAEVSKEKILSHIELLKNNYDYVICEGAGGLYVPLTENEFFLDLIEQSKLPVVLVTRTALGTINHTLLSLEVLKQRNIPAAGIVFNRYQGTALENNNIEMIRRYANLPVLIISELKNISEPEIPGVAGEQFFERLMLL